MNPLFKATTVTAFWMAFTPIWVWIMPASWGTTSLWFRRFSVRQFPRMIRHNCSSHNTFQAAESAPTREPSSRWGASLASLPSGVSGGGTWLLISSWRVLVRRSLERRPEKLGKWCSWGCGRLLNCNLHRHGMDLFRAGKLHWKLRKKSKRYHYDKRHLIFHDRNSFSDHLAFHVLELCI
jgi:hypothetical protein